ncbi:hypothetical protein PDIG_56430 [Penicillium digitatum PHI26]|uniref:Uncharacterized protein n=2 Tax=Penicillium digitatum TaxID=36651 RepID=K9FM96_PEND2|nr:hypothetical protein PDIP_65990 [Penicillium digitatum Pd1]EKV09088.1 hypothetical protein PDIP_65990 [Penicillium digitatum Pd1]EKV10354.1 hypothetical protein PDIG_56430 [Penicillium digitatum PHI26]
MDYSLKHLQAPRQLAYTLYNAIAIHVEVCKWGIGHGYFENGGPTTYSLTGTVHADVPTGFKPGP